MKNDTPVPTAPPAAIQGSAGAAPNGAEPKLLTEPFPCPHCGQMLGPDVRVCAACRQPVDLRRVEPTAPAPPQFAPAPAPQRPIVRFSWGIFLIVFLLGGLVANVAVAALGLVKGGFVLIGLQVLTSAWVLFDAREKGIPRPLRWSLGSLLLWILFFPWYLARRRQRNAVCPLVEDRLQPFVLALVIGIVIQNAVGTLLFDAARNFLPK